jgi:hypothetical protein
VSGDPHIRSQHPELIDAVAEGAAVSATLRALVDEVESAEVVIYLVWQQPRSSTVAAHVAFISSAGGRRYVYVAVDPKYRGSQLISLLGHELQHVVEIAREPSVVDERSLSAYYRRIGFSRAGWDAGRFESEAAIEVGQQVMREVLAPGSAATRAQ